MDTAKDIKITGDQPQEPCDTCELAKSKQQISDISMESSPGNIYQSYLDINTESGDDIEDGDEAGDTANIKEQSVEALIKWACDIKPQHSKINDSVRYSTPDSLPRQNKDIFIYNQLKNELQHSLLTPSSKEN